MSFIGKKPSNTYKDILYVDNSNSGVDATRRVIKTGEGSSSCIKLADNTIMITPVDTDSTSVCVVTDKDSNAILTVDTTNDIVRVGLSQIITNTQYAYFGISNVGSSNMVVDTHYGLPFSVGYMATSAEDAISFGTGTNPATAVTLTGAGLFRGHSFVNSIWYLPDNIIVDAVSVWIGADADNGDTVRCHLMSYAVDTRSGVATSGDLTDGVVVADGGDITSAGDEQADYQSMSLVNPTVGSGRGLFFTFRQDGVNSDYAIKATIKYHLV